MNSRIILLALAAAGAVLVAAACGGNTETEPTSTVRPAPNKEFGDAAARVQIVEYFDYR